MLPDLQGWMGAAAGVHGWTSTVAGFVGLVCVVLGVVALAAVMGCSCNSRACKRRKRAVRLWPRRIKYGAWATLKYTLMAIAGFFVLRFGMRLMSWSLSQSSAAVPGTSHNPYYRPPMPVPSPPPPMPVPSPPLATETRFAVAYDHGAKGKKPKHRRKRSQRA